MGFRRHDLQEAVLIPGTWPFRIWGYGTIDPLTDVLRPNYFEAARGILRPGELIYVSAQPRRPTPPGPATARESPIRMALVMVKSAPRGTASVRLVQDFGGPDDDHALPGAGPGSPATTHPRKRGRPPGSKIIRKQG